MKFNFNLTRSPLDRIAFRYKTSCSLFTTKNFLNLDTPKPMDYSNLFDYIKTFKGNNLKTYKDYVIVEDRMLGKNFTEKMNYLVYKFYPKSSLIPYMILRQILVVLVCLSAIYYLIKKKKRLLLIPVIIFVLVSNLRNNRYQHWRYIKSIELGKDLQNLNLTLLNDKQFTTKINDVYIFNPKFGRMFNFLAKDSGQARDLLAFNVKENVYYIYLKDCVVTDKDLLALCIRGYNLRQK